MILVVDERLGFDVELDGFVYDNLKSISKDFDVPIELLKRQIKKGDSPKVTALRIARVVGLD